MTWEKLKMELLRVRFDEQVRSEQRRTVRTAIESEASGALKPSAAAATLWHNDGPVATTRRQSSRSTRGRYT